MTADELVEILQLINTDGIGPVSFYSWLRKTGSIRASLDEIAAQKEIFPRGRAELLVEKARQIGAEIITFKDSRYPQSLKELNDAPPVVYTLGRGELLNYSPAVSIVGARNSSIAGRKIASRIAYDLTQNDVLVISGMARGIDSAAHKGAMYAKDQQGPTIAVLGTGVDEIYPIENKELYTRIREQGLIISEFPFGTKAQVSNFPRRNRIISALSDATLVVEAGIHSGSLITAKLALEQGKEIFAVPGSPAENKSSGSNQLIKDGAVLTESADDILDFLALNRNYRIKNNTQAFLPLDKAENNVNISEQKKMPTGVLKSQCPLLEMISYEGVDIDELFRSCGLSQADFFSQVLELELSGKIERQVGNRLARIK